MDHQDIGIEFLKALNRYFTPLAVGVVLCALIVLPELPRPRFAIAAGVVLVSLAFNAVSAAYVVEHPRSWKRLGYLRVGVNTALNALAYLALRESWPIVWVLFALGPVAMAFYGDVGETFAVLGVSGAVIAGPLLWERSSDPRAWGEAAVQVFFMLLLSLFLIRMAALVRSERRKSA